MKTFISNILLAFVWVAVAGHFNSETFMMGFVLAYLILWTVQGAAAEPTRYFTKASRVFSFIMFFISELVKANLRVAHDVITARHHGRPGVVAIPLSVQSDAQITLLANLITLTPGTLSLDVSADRKFLFVHAMYIYGADEFRRNIKEGFERRVMEVLE
ncbi:MAG: Na+/H+ antiporter subunit E [Syntrophobacteraceae bacterium]